MKDFVHGTWMFLHADGIFWAHEATCGALWWTAAQHGRCLEMKEQLGNGKLLLVLRTPGVFCWGAGGGIFGLTTCGQLFDTSFSRFH